ISTACRKPHEPFTYPKPLNLHPAFFARPNLFHESVDLTDLPWYPASRRIAMTVQRLPTVGTPATLGGSAPACRFGPVRGRRCERPSGGSRSSYCSGYRERRGAPVGRRGCRSAGTAHARLALAGRMTKAR